MFCYSQAQFKTAESMVKLPYVCILCNGAIGVLEMLAVNTGFEEHSNYTDRVKRACLKTILAFVGLHVFICFMAVAFNVNGGSTRYMETHTL